MENETTSRACAGESLRNPSTIRIAIVEDMTFLAETIAHLCRSWDFEVSTMATSGKQGCEDILRTRPDIVLLDLSLPDMDGVTIAGKINTALPSTRIIVVSGSWNDYQIHRLSTVNIQGFVDKFAEGLMGLRRAIQIVHAGEIYFSPRYVSASHRLRRSDAAFFKRLSGREQEVLVWAAQALSDEEIGVQLNVSAATAQTHRREIMRKLNIHSTPKLMRYGLELGMYFGPVLVAALPT